jgi:ABC-2 type transport system permease protein
MKQSAVVSFGVATVVRDVAISAGVVLGLVYLFPRLRPVISSSRWRQHSQHGSALLVSPWGGLGLIAACAAVALLVGWLLLRLRDA